MSSHALKKNSQPQLPVSDDVLHSLQRGEWVFPTFVPALRATFEATQRRNEGHFLAELPLFILTSMFYKKEFLPISVATRFFAQRQSVAGKIATLTTPEERTFWESAFATVSPETAPCEASTPEIVALETAVGLLDRHVRVKSTSPVSKAIAAFASFDSEKFRSASHPHYLGCIFLRLNRPAGETALSLAHELAHQELFLLNFADRLITAAADYRLVHAPFQGRQRPSIGRLHAAHALFRMTDHERATQDARLQKHVETLQATIDTFQNSDLTEFGRKLVYEVYQPHVTHLCGRG